MGHLQKIMYVHVPAAWMTFISFFVVLVFSVRYLWKRRENDDLLAASAAEVGATFTGLTLVLGMIWGRPAWGVWWMWDARLTSTLVLFLIFVGYLALRAFVDDADQRARWSAAVGAIGALNVPIVYMSVKWWRTLHQPPSSPVHARSGVHDGPAAQRDRAAARADLLHPEALRDRAARASGRALAEAAAMGGRVDNGCIESDIHHRRVRRDVGRAPRLPAAPRSQRAAGRAREYRADDARARRGDPAMKTSMDIGGAVADRRACSRGCCSVGSRRTSCSSSRRRSCWRRATRASACRCGSADR